jgi:CDGSH-type Zn-finger protein
MASEHGTPPDSALGSVESLGINYEAPTTKLKVLRPVPQHPHFGRWANERDGRATKKKEGGETMSEPKVAQKEPYAVKVEKGKTYYWCSCGRSTNQPFCSGAHKDTSFVPVAFTAEETKEVYLCGCKHTKTPPFCDGTHTKLE